MSVQIDLDPAVVIAQHQSDGDDCMTCEPFSLVRWPCQPYLLAMELTAARALASELAEYGTSMEAALAIATAPKRLQEIERNAKAEALRHAASYLRAGSRVDREWLYAQADAVEKDELA